MKIRRGFTLVELAIVLVVLGLIAAMVMPTLKSGILRGKMSEARATLQAVRDGVIGVAQAQANSRILPATLAPLGAPKDPWGNAIRYRRDPNLTGDVCAANATASTFISPEGQTIADVAFVVASSGPDFQEDAALNASTDARQADDDLILAVTLPHLKTILCERAKGAQTPGALATWDDILLHTVAVTSGLNDLGAKITPSSIVLGIPNGTTPAFSYGCVWYTGDLNATSGTPVCTSGKCTLGKGLRAYFTFTVQKVGDPLADGFTFAVVSAATNAHQSCGGKGSALGYASTFNPGDDGVSPFVLPPKMAVEFDFYTSGAFGDPKSHRDHLGIAYWGSNTGSSDLDRGKDDLKHNFTPSDGSPPHPNYVRSSNQTYFDETGTVTYPVRVEILRNATSGNYTTHVWFNCAGCSDLTASGLDGGVAPEHRYAASEYFRHSTTMNATWNALMDNVLLGWTEGTGSARQRVTLKSAQFFFPE
jgi:prepilin-type N-terminal cleavage/methylation domain-containing protein